MSNNNEERSMDESSNVFKKNYQDYCAQIEKVDFESIKDTLGIRNHKNGYVIPFFNQEILILDKGIMRLSDKRPDYMVSVIIAKYILLSPQKPKIIDGWASFKDFKKAANFISASAFSVEAERSIAKLFSGRLGDFKNACEESGGVPHEFGISYDLSMMFHALPRISILLLFNDIDEDFPAKCTILFQKHAEYYLDPESLIMVVGSLFKTFNRSFGDKRRDESRTPTG